MTSNTYMTQDALASVLKKVPRTPLAYLPTPLEEANNLSKALGGPKILIKRDDLTGQALGGNKMRHLEYRLADALRKGCDTYVYADSKNAGRQTACACAKTGMKCILVTPPLQRPYQGNMLLSVLFGAELREAGESKEDGISAAEQIGIELAAAGHKPYVAQAEPMFHMSGVISYLNATLELQKQLPDIGITKVHIFLVNGHSQVGLQLGAKILGLPWRVTGIGVGQDFEQDFPLPGWSKQVASTLGLPTDLPASEIETTFDYVETYSVPTKGSVEAINLTASTEGIVLDPAYSGKSMHGMIDYITSGKISPDVPVVFIHTGGIPKLFEHADEVVYTPHTK